MLKSNKTSLILARMMLVCTTRLCTPYKNRITMVRLEREKSGWSQREVRKETWAVAGSLIQYKAPTAAHIDTKVRMSRHLNAPGFVCEITSVNLRSNAFKSSQATCSKLDISIVDR